MIQDLDLNGHVVFRTFGRYTHDEDGNVLIKNPVEEAAKLLDGKSIDSISLSLMLQEHYETYYHLFNHDATYVPPLALVTLHPKERYSPFSRRRRLLQNYMHYGIKDLFGYNFTEFIDRTRAEVDEMLEEAAFRKHRKDARDDKDARELERTLSQGDQDH